MSVTFLYTIILAVLYVLKVQFYKGHMPKGTMLALSGVMSVIRHLDWGALILLIPVYL